MAKQVGLIKITGTIGGATFTKDGVVRAARQSNKAQFKSSPSMVRVRENSAEFTSASEAGKLLRQALRRQLQGASDRYMSSRLLKVMFKIMASDTTHVRGERMVQRANIGELVGFDFNAGAPLGTVFAGDYAIDVNGKTATVTLEGLVPDVDTRAPIGATHYGLELGVVVVDFAAGTHRIVAVADVPDPAVLSVATVPTITMTADLGDEPTATEVVVVVMGLNFFQEINGLYYSLQNKTSNPLGVVYCA
jgi:hypothetical protein